MKTIIAAAAALLAATTAATAGGLAPAIAQPAVEAPAAEAAVAVAEAWTGAYLGLHVDDVLAHSTYKPLDLTVEEGGTVVGLQAGYLHDFGKLVLGAEIARGKLWDDHSTNDYRAVMSHAQVIAGYDLGKFLPYVGVGKGEQYTLDADLTFSGDRYAVGLEYLVTENITLGAEYSVLQLRDVMIEDLDADYKDLALRVAYRF